MRPIDPAPSRLTYRINRLLLTPGFRRFLKLGLPILIVLSAAAFWASDPDRRQDAVDRVAELRRQIEERPEFMVRMMAVENASSSVAADIRSLLSVDFPLSSFDLDLDAIRKQVETLDIVQSASVHIRSGGILAVDVTQRIPVVVWRQGDTLELLDGEGHRVSALATRSDGGQLPLIAGDGADSRVAEALRLYEIGQPVASRIRGLLRVGERRWDVVLDRDQRIMLPEDNPQAALEKVVALDAAQDLLSRDISRVDFRNPKRPILRLTKGSIEAMIDAHMTNSGDVTR